MVDTDTEREHGEKGKMNIILLVPGIVLMSVGFGITCLVIISEDTCQDICAHGYPTIPLLLGGLGLVLAVLSFAMGRFSHDP